MVGLIMMPKLSFVADIKIFTPIGFLYNAIIPLDGNDMAITLSETMEMKWL